MKVIDLTDEHQQIYFVCLEEWSDEIKEAGNHKEMWHREMKDRGLRVKLAADENGQVGGMIEYMPIEYGFAEGSNLYFINCIWVHGYKQGRGNFQKRGMGKALLTAAEDDAKALGAKGMAAWGISLPFWMKASWFKKHGYKKVDSQRGLVLLWKPFSSDAVPPQWIRKKYTPELTPDKVTVTSFINGQCPAGNMLHERAKRAVHEFGDKVIFRSINTNDKQAMRQYGEKDSLYINTKKLSPGPPPSYEKIKRLIAKRVRRL
ncbi:MAG: GNAT family N-acetyltransferase [Candidatus Aminicenantes bacterium]|nr:GNAT family N-acetyltransferase [Candidatus Aminicenantes bacterium]